MKATLEFENARLWRDEEAPTAAGQSQTVPPARHETIARRAYEIWQRHGCPSGTSFRDWLAAEAELRSARRWGRVRR